MLAELKNKLSDEEECFPDILGQEEVKKQLKSALLMGRHIIVVGPPGVGKTTLAKNVAALLPKAALKKGAGPKKGEGQTGRFVRIQGSPDLTSEDLLGDIDPIKALEFGPLDTRAFTPGKIFKANRGVLFFDEVNRCPEKLQNALLQVLEEGKATIGSYSVDFPSEFVFIGTMNPEDTSTEKLSDVFLDRFDVIYMSYPATADVERSIVEKRAKTMDVTLPEHLLSLSIGFVRHLRRNDKLEKKPSLRASIGLCERACANAYLAGRKEVYVEDIQGALQSVISHRIRLKPSARYLQTTADIVNEEFEKFSETYAKHAEREAGDGP